MATSRALGYLESRKNITGSACGLVGLVLTFTGVAGPYWPVVVAGLYGAGALIAPPERPALPDFPDPSAQLDEVRQDFEKLRGYLAEVGLPQAAAERAGRLDEVLTALLVPRQATFAPSRRPARTLAAPAEDPSTSTTRASGRHAESTHRTPLLHGQTLPATALDPGWAAELLAQDPEGLHILARAVRQDIPEAVDAYARTRWWTRLTPGQQPPEDHLVRQLSLIDEEVRQLADTLRDTEARRQETHTRYLEDRSQ
ncbi:hypothetical protein [Streptomyces sp. YIM S03343]